MSLVRVPVTWAQAREFVDEHHRRHRAPPGHKFSIGVERDGRLVGVVVVGRPVARHFDDGTTLEVTRVATDGTRNACSLLYGSAWQAGRALGYQAMITYTRVDESGASLRAAGWQQVAERRPRSGWSCESRPRSAPAEEPVGRFLWLAPGSRLGGQLPS